MSKPQSTTAPSVPAERPHSPKPKKAPMPTAESQLAGAMAAAFKNNSVSNGDDMQGDEENRELELEIRPPEGYTSPPKSHNNKMSSVYPPNPCERCVRTNKTCIGIAGARCEHCKSLHQKCSNSTGPPRGRHAVALFQAHADSGSAPPRPKRKAATKPASKQRNENDEEDELDDDEDEDQRPKKKQATSSTAPNANVSPRRAKLLKKAADLEAAWRQFQTNTTKEMTRLGQMASSLIQELREAE